MCCVCRLWIFTLQWRIETQKPEMSEADEENVESLDLINNSVNKQLLSFLMTSLLTYSFIAMRAEFCYEGVLIRQVGYHANWSRFTVVRCRLFQKHPNLIMCLFSPKAAWRCCRHHQLVKPETQFVMNAETHWHFSVCDGSDIENNLCRCGNSPPAAAGFQSDNDFLMEAHL